MWTESLFTGIKILSNIENYQVYFQKLAWQMLEMIIKC